MGLVKGIVSSSEQTRFRQLVARSGEYTTPKRIERAPNHRETRNRTLTSHRGCGRGRGDRRGDHRLAPGRGRNPTPPWFQKPCQDHGASRRVAKNSRSSCSMRERFRYLDRTRHQISAGMRRRRRQSGTTVSAPAALPNIISAPGWRKDPQPTPLCFRNMTGLLASASA